MMAVHSTLIMMTVMKSATISLDWPGRPAKPRARTHAFSSSGGPGGFWDDRLYHADNLQVLEHLAAEMPGQFDLIYIDPPFNTGRNFILSGDLTGPAYSDRHDGGITGYLTQLYPRLCLIHQLLSPTGTLYLHCDYRVSSHLRLLLDEIFRPENLRAQIIWHYQSGGRQKRCWSMKHDVIWMYSRSNAFTFNAAAVGIRRGRAPRNHMKQIVTAEGKSVFTIRSNGKIYSYSEDDLLTPASVWTDISHLQQKDPERTGYATQKPEKLIERIILASSNPGALVADFYCGSGTTLATAKRLGRRWIGCDTGAAAIGVCSKRLSPGTGPTQHALYTPLGDGKPGA